VLSALRTILSTLDVQKSPRVRKNLAQQHDTFGKPAIFCTIALFALFSRRKKICIQINALTECQSSCAQSYPHNMCRTSAQRLLASPSIPETRFLDAACFLLAKKFPLRIKALSYSQNPCAQSYPQKMCRTSSLVHRTVPGLFAVLFRMQIRICMRRRPKKRLGQGVFTAYSVLASFLCGMNFPI
jgi:hypothetical protein